MTERLDAVLAPMLDDSLKRMLLAKSQIATVLAWNEVISQISHAALLQVEEIESKKAPSAPLGGAEQDPQDQDLSSSAEEEQDMAERKNLLAQELSRLSLSNSIPATALGQYRDLDQIIGDKEADFLHSRLYEQLKESGNIDVWVRGVTLFRDKIVAIRTAAIIVNQRANEVKAPPREPHPSVQLPLAVGAAASASRRPQAQQRTLSQEYRQLIAYDLQRARTRCHTFNQVLRAFVAENFPRPLWDRAGSLLIPDN